MGLVVGSEMKSLTSVEGRRVCLQFCRFLWVRGPSTIPMVLTLLDRGHLILSSLIRISRTRTHTPSFR